MYIHVYEVLKKTEVGISEAFGYTDSLSMHLAVLFIPELENKIDLYEYLTYM